jgi:hypothetical protein
MLSVLQDPGPKTDTAHGGSGFLCLENDDNAAERFATLLADAGIAPARMTPWNAYPWYINRKPNAAELAAGLDPLRRLLGRLPHIRVVMLRRRPKPLAEVRRGASDDRGVVRRAPDLPHGGQGGSSAHRRLGRSARQTSARSSLRPES